MAADQMETLQFWANIIAGAAAVASFIAAYAAWNAARETRNATEARLVSTLLDAYASPQMLSDMILLRRWVEEQGQRATDEFRRLRQDNYENVSQLDQARRRVAHFFQKIHALRTSKFLGESGVRAVATKAQIEFYREVIEPLEAAISADYDRSSFDDLGALYGVKRVPPVTARP